MKTFVILCALLVAVSAARTPAARLRDYLPKSRIVGGNLAYKGQFPYQVALFMSDNTGSWFCGGSIIANNWILTAAHCTDGANDVSVYAGTTNFNVQDPNTQYRSVPNLADIKIHTQYNPSTLNNDISVIRLAQPLSLNSYVATIPMASSSVTLSSLQGQTAVASGWGKVSDSTNSITNDLRYVDLVIENHQTCKNYYIAGLVNDGVICANTAGGARSTCNGDSGGPLKYGNALIGVTSFVSAAGCQSGGPDGFTFVPKFRGWINQHTGI